MVSYYKEVSPEFSFFFFAASRLFLVMIFYYVVGESVHESLMSFVCLEW